MKVSEDNNENMDNNINNNQINFDEITLNKKRKDQKSLTANTFMNKS